MSYVEGTIVIPMSDIPKASKTTALEYGRQVEEFFAVTPWGTVIHASSAYSAEEARRISYAWIGIALALEKHHNAREREEAAAEKLKAARHELAGTLTGIPNYTVQPQALRKAIDMILEERGQK